MSSDLATQTPSDSQRLIERPWFVALVLIACAFAAYFPALRNEFYNDDAIFLNHAQRVLEHPLALITERPLGYFRPVYAAFVTLVYSVAGIDPAPYYFAAILLHAATAFLVWRVAHRLLARPIAALCGALFFCGCFAHSEATVWIAAHNSTLVCFFALLATLTHIRACESNRIGYGIATAALVAITLLTKEPGIVVLAWLPLVEWRIHGFKRCFSKSSLLRYGLIVAGAAVYLAANPRLLGDALATDGSETTKELRSTFGFVTLGRLLGTSFWLFSPVRSAHEDLEPWLGALALIIPVILAFVISKRRGYDVVFAIAFLVAALVPACSTRMQQMNGSRLYYFPTAGAALMVAAVIAAIEDRGGFRSRAALGGLVAGFIVFGAVHAHRIHAVNDSDYLPISKLQTRLAKDLGDAIPRAKGKLVYVLEPWLDNIMHAQQFLQLFAGVDPAKVRRTSFKRDDLKWLKRQRDNLGNLVFDCDANGALIPANSLPSTRNSAQNLSRDADTGVRYDDVRVLVISP